MYRSTGVFLSFLLLNWHLIRQAQAGCANALGPCVGGECPTESDAGQTYTCIDDTCCPTQSTMSSCIDSAINCNMFTGYSCIANECPNQDDAGQSYVCIDDTCCPPTSNCRDGATNCPQFRQECTSYTYRACMQSHCRKTCGFCTK